ncbi:permease prefix domain 1-containing protein [Mycoplasmatota bacterium WC30]
MNNIKKFVSNILKGLFNEEDKKELIEILTTSLEEKVDDLVEQGNTREEAEGKAINEFGDSHDILSAFPENEKNKTQIVKKKRNQFAFSFGSYLIITGLAIYVNLVFLPGPLWFFFIAIGLLFWPLVMLYHYINVRR